MMHLETAAEPSRPASVTGICDSNRVSDSCGTVKPAPPPDSTVACAMRDGFAIGGLSCPWPVVLSLIHSMGCK